MQLATTVLLWLSAIGCGAIAGVYFAFSTFIMTALGQVPATAGIAAMQSINRVILRSLFMLLFFGTSIACLALALLALFQWAAPGSLAMLAGGVLYVVAMFVCTIAFNVPLNNELDVVSSESGAANATWARYQKDWTRWNHLRTVGSLAAAALFVYALVARVGM